MLALKVSRDFGELSFYKSSNNGPKIVPTILGISGFGCSHYNYLDLIPELKKIFNIVLIDNRGMGKSDKTKTKYSLTDVALDAIAVMDELKILEFGLMGISMGGFIAQEIIRLAPKRVSAVSLMCTLSSGEDFIKPTSLTEEGLRQFNTLDISKQAELSTMATVHPSLGQKNPEQYKRIIDLRIEHKTDLEECIRQNYSAISFLETKFDLSVIKCPTLAMAGTNDRFVNPANVQAFDKNISQCQTTLIEETDHFFFLEKPQVVAAVLNRFFKEVL